MVSDQRGSPRGAITDQASAESEITGAAGTCEDLHKNACGQFWVYDVDDIEDGASDGVTDQAEYDAAAYRVAENVRVDNALEAPLGSAHDAT